MPLLSALGAETLVLFRSLYLLRVLKGERPLAVLDRRPRW